MPLGLPFNSWDFLSKISWALVDIYLLAKPPVLFEVSETSSPSLLNVCFPLVTNLAKPGTFAGNDAIVAFARNNQMNVVIHQLNAPLWQVRNKTSIFWPNF